jgi:hypothetical protein
LSLNGCSFTGALEEKAEVRATSALCQLLNLKEEAGPDLAWIAQDPVKLAEFAELVQTNRRRPREL